MFYSFLSFIHLFSIELNFFSFYHFFHVVFDDQLLIIWNIRIKLNIFFFIGNSKTEGEDELKKRQLMELAIINGTYRDSGQRNSGE